MTAPVPASGFASIAAALLLNASGPAPDLAVPQAPELDAITVAVTDRKDPSSDSPTAVKREIGRCQVLVWVTADGLIRAAQVVKSTGYTRLDAACLKATIGKKIEPGHLEGHAVDEWVVLPIIWEAKGNMATRPPKRPDRPDLPIAVLATNQQLQIRPPDYPSGALTHGEQGDCVVHVDVNFSGQVEQLNITESTGSAEVDKALADAIYLARFIPAQRDQKPARASADIALHWQLPDAPSAAPR